MKISELFEGVDLSKKGTYASASFDSESKKLIADFIKDNEIQNPIKTDKLHCTLIYSRVHVPEMKGIGTYDKPMKCKPKGFNVWETQPDKDGKTKNCLVLLLDCPELVARHKKLMKEHPTATYDYDKFKVHVTLSYDIGDMDIKELPEIKQTLNLVKEKVKVLDSGWAKKNTKGSKT